MPLIHGFELIRHTHIRELKTDARLYRHEKTGAELLSLTNDDENKVFGITFRTPPEDSTGVAHILEHCVLCGSRKYPVKEPFVELIKGSLHTFLNAFTYPDRTCYPVASQNLRDFYNLIDVYLDAVFYPRLNPFIFMQEGWHYDLEAPEAPLTYKGVVFNEMKGNYSSPDSVLSEYSLQSLFPGHPYGVDSGGDPKEIPKLTFERFKAFHQTYYHPSNARIYFYGDDPPEERLRITDEYLRDFEAIQVDSTIPLMLPFDRPRRAERPFMVGEQGHGAPRGMVTVNWVLTETTEVETNFSLQILEYILLGMPGSPLRKALIDSGLGEDLAGEGLGAELRQIYFSTGLKGIEVQKASEVEALILETLGSLKEKGIDPMTVEAALNTVEFRLRENNTGQFPRGLVLMLRSLSTWLYESDPLALLAFEGPLGEVKSRAREGRGFFEQMIDRFFLKNPHRTTLLFRPDPGLGEREERAEKARLHNVRAAMAEEELNRIAEDTKALRRIQETPDPPEALATIPRLRLSDLERRNRSIPLKQADWSGTPILYHDLFTNGIAYMDVGFNLHLLPEKYLPYVPLFGRALVEMGTEKEDFVRLTQRISAKTGGIHPESFASTVIDSQKSTVWLFLRGKAMMNQVGDLMSLLKDLLLAVRLDNRERFRQMLHEAKARAEQALVPMGHRVVNLRLKSHFAEAHWVAEQMSGISNLFFLRELAKAVDEDWVSVLEDLEEMRRILVNRRAMIVNVTLEDGDRARFDPKLEGFLNALPEAPATEAHWERTKRPAPFEGLAIPSHVNYVGKGTHLYSLGYRFHGSSMVITRYLRNVWLWDRVRVRGGAYGAFCSLDRHSGVLSFVSYRDPNIMETLEAFDQCAGFLEKDKPGREEIEKSIIGAIGDLDAHLLPDAKGFTSMLWYLTGNTDELRQRVREEVLGTEARHFQEFSGILKEASEKGIVKILASPGALESAGAGQSGWLEMVKVL